jgi:hypothetical protein
MEETNFLYSASMNCFYPANWPGDKPDDLIPVSDDVVKTYSSISPTGKARGPGNDGLPTWIDDPNEFTKENAELMKSALMNAANSALAPLQDAADLNMATDEEKAALTAWKKYRVLLMRIDTSKAPDIEWPEKPA